MRIRPHPAIDPQACHELPQFGILDHSLVLSNNLMAKFPASVGKLIRVLNQALPHSRINPISTHDQIRAQPPPVVQQNRAHAAHLPKLDAAHPRFHQDFATELGGSVRLTLV